MVASFKKITDKSIIILPTLTNHLQNPVKYISSDDTSLKEENKRCSYDVSIHGDAKDFLGCLIHIFNGELVRDHDDRIRHTVEDLGCGFLDILDLLGF